jgi:6-pyruvoyltetrahydropterin/6-carboxytetrahydropterin synthase
VYKLKVVRKFDAAHQLEGYVGKCANLHGHTWKVVFTFAFDDGEFIELQKLSKVEGLSFDFGELKKQLDEILPDHHYLNSVYKLNPTAENLARYLYDDEKQLNLTLDSVEVWETENACAEYSRR